MVSYLLVSLGYATMAEGGTKLEKETRGLPEASGCHPLVTVVLPGQALCTLGWLSYLLTPRGDDMLSQKMDPSHL